MAEEEMENCSHQCGSCGAGNCGSRTEGPVYFQQNDGTNIKHVIAVVSGKGGVGKSLVTSLLAVQMQKKGLKVGILDADITGPSIPRSFGITDQVGITEEGIYPCTSECGIKVMSTNLLLPAEDTPVAWRGPVLSGILGQFYTDVIWGDLDVLLVDMPPGTSDVFLTMFHQFPVEGIVMVSAPQDLVGMIVGKAVNLAHDMGKDVIGLVENMAYFICDGCDKKHYIFGEPQAKAIAEKYEIPAYATLPIDPKFAALVDVGKVSEYDVEDALDTIIDKINEVIAE